MKKQNVKQSEAESSIENFDVENRAKKYFILKKELLAGQKNKKSIAATNLMKVEAEKEKAWNQKLDKMKALEQIRVLNKNKVAKLIDKQVKSKLNINEQAYNEICAEMPSPMKRTTANITSKLSNGLINTLNKLAADRGSPHGPTGLKLQGRETLKVSSFRVESNDLNRRGSQRHQEPVGFDREHLSRKVSLGVDNLASNQATTLKKNITLAANRVA